MAVYAPDEYPSRLREYVPLPSGSNIIVTATPFGLSEGSRISKLTTSDPFPMIEIMAISPAL